MIDLTTLTIASALAAGDGSQAGAPTASTATATSTPLPEAPEPFRLALTLDAWLPRLSGHFTDGGPARDAKVDIRDPDLRGSEPTFAGELSVAFDRYDVSLRGFAFSTEGSGPATSAFSLDGVAIAAGAPFSSSFSWWSAGIEVAYDLWRPLAERPTPWSEPQAGWTPPSNGTDFAILGLVSADLSAIERALTNEATGSGSDAKESFVSVEAGLGFRLGFDAPSGTPVVRRVEIGAKAAAGLTMPMGDGDFGGAARIEAGLTAWFCAEGAATIGYRLVGGSFDGDEMSLDGSLQGLFAGVRIAF